MNKTLNDLIKEAQGNRTQNEFALHCEISSAALTRIKNGEYKATPETLKKIANRAYNGVTYEQLMIAAGYLTEPITPHPAGSIEEMKVELKRLGIDGDEKELLALLKKIGSLTPEQKKLILTMIENLK